MVSPVPADQRRSDETMAQITAIAEQIFRRLGVDPAIATRGGGRSNITWLAGGLALRLATERGTGHLRREAGLGSLLPSEVGYPVSIESGVTDGYEWSLSKQIEGRNLGEVWPGLSWQERVTATRQLWKKVEAVHRVSAQAAAPYVLNQSMFYPAKIADARKSLARLLDHQMVAREQAQILDILLERFWAALEKAPRELNHGDFTIENALYHSGRVVALLDFEYAIIAPPELDANELIKSAFLPPEEPDPLPDPGSQDLKQFQETVLELVQPMLTHPGSQDLLVGFSALLGFWMLENELAHPDEKTPSNLERLQKELSSLCDDRRGYL